MRARFKQSQHSLRPLIIAFLKKHSDFGEALLCGAWLLLLSRIA
jgi:hypothetical protein